jgi:hypothetical protein
VTDKVDIFAAAGISDDDFESDVTEVAFETPADEAPEAVSAPEIVPGSDEKISTDPGTSEGPARDANGRFAPKAETKAETPNSTNSTNSTPEPVAPPADLNMTAAERAAWASTPPEVRTAVERRIGELQRGYQTAVEPLRPFLEMAGDAGKLAQAIQSYVGIEQTLRADPMAGLDQICRNLGTTLQDVAAKVTGQPAQPRDAMVDGLRSELAALKQQFGGVAEQVQAVRTNTVTQTVQQFAAAHPRFDELAGDIAHMLKTGFATSLEDAYEKADRLKPAPAPAAPAFVAPAVVTEVPRARTPVANLSVSGTPANGSNPSARTPPPDRRAHLANIFDRVGL